MKINFIFFGILFLIFSSCTSDLDTIPNDPDVTTSEQIYQDPAAYKQVLAKLYAGLALSGQQGPAGQADIEGIDEGFGQYLRALWYHQELPTDEAVIGWNDQTIKDFHNQSWTASDGFIFAFYSRIFYQIPLCNEFLRETTADKLNSRGQSNLMSEIETYRNEARFLRALSYWHALDAFRNVPFITEADGVGSFFPQQILGPDLFNYLESELKEIENTITPARQNEYGRADQGAVWALLAKLYLNAEVYTGTPRWNDCLEYCNKVINAGYSLEPNYNDLFLADNDNSNEIIFPIVFDGVSTRTWGGMTFIIRAAIGGSMDPLASGVAGGWGGTRTTRELVNKFGEIGGLVSEPSVGNTVQYPKIYTPGSFQNFDFSDTENALSSVNSDNTFEGYKYFSVDNSEFLITRIPSENAPYFGDNDMDGVLEQFGSRIIVPEAGLYRIQVDLNDNTYVMTKVSWAIVGDAIGGWDNDINMEWSEEDNALKVNVLASDGEFRFRANNDWEISFGDNEGDRVLDYDGDNIPIEAGDYEILLYINRPDYSYQIKFSGFDLRPNFYSEGQSLDINDISQFVEGYAVTKFKNITSEGGLGKDTDFPDTDFPMFRLADFHLMAAECIVRNNGNINEALNHFNLVRARAYGGQGGGISAEELTMDMLIDERARELYWECHRRTDLVRFGQFTNGTYLWQWKGGVQDGAVVEDFRDIYPIPSSDVAANLNLIQNAGY